MGGFGINTHVDAQFTLNAAGRYVNDNFDKSKLNACIVKNKEEKKALVIASRRCEPAGRPHRSVRLLPAPFARWHTRSALPRPHLASALAPRVTPPTCKPSARRIAAGEEIYASYGETYWRARSIDPDTGLRVPAPPKSN